MADATTDLGVELSRLRDAATRAAANLAELEADPRFALLAQAPLEGTTADRWGDASRAIASLWDRSARLLALLDEAERRLASRGWRGVAETRGVEELLRGRSIELPVVEIPIDARPLVASRRARTFVRPDELLAAMSSSFAEVVATVTAITAAWDATAPRVAALRDVAGQAAAAARELDDRAAPPASAIALDQLAARVAADPLGVAPDEVDVVEREVLAAHAAMVEAASLRAHLPAQVGAAHQELERLDREEHAALDADRRARARIAPLDLAPLERRRPELARRLAEVEASAGTGDWTATSALLRSWTDDLDHAIGQARGHARAAAAAVHRRDQLRGLVGAWVAMATARGLIERSTVEAAHRRVDDELRGAPCDLDRAEALVQELWTVLDDRRDHPVEDAR